MNRLLYAGLGLATLMASCRSQEPAASTTPAGAEATPAPKKEYTVIAPRTAEAVAGRTVGSAVSSPRVFVYRLNDASQYDLVPVMMNEARTAIVSYPAPVDLRRGDELCLPTRLDDGYLLDNRGIGPTVALLSYTYAQYAALKEAPSMEELMAHIANRYPLAWYAWCGRRADYVDIVGELNAKIREGELCQ